MVWYFKHRAALPYLSSKKVTPLNNNFKKSAVEEALTKTGPKL
jgi:hypothetical protein